MVQHIWRMKSRGMMLCTHPDGRCRCRKSYMKQHHVEHGRSSVGCLIFRSDVFSAYMRYSFGRFVIYNLLCVTLFEKINSEYNITFVVSHFATTVRLAAYFQWRHTPSNSLRFRRKHIAKTIRFLNDQKCSWFATNVLLICDSSLKTFII